MRCAAYLRLSRVEQNNGMAIERQLFAIQKSVESFGGSLDHVLEDIMSGRKNDRPNIEQITNLIKTRAIDVAIFYRVDRLGRDIELLISLGKLLEKTGVKAYVCARGSFIDWKKTEDWEYWTSAAVAAEKESRTISERLRLTHEFNRHMGHAAFKVPLGYRRINREYQLSDDGYAAFLISEFIESKGNFEHVASMLRVRGIKMTSRGVKHWIENPLHRLPVFTGLEDESGEPIKRPLMTYEQSKEINRLLQEKSLLRRSPKQGEKVYTLVGLVQCKCGAKCSIRSVGGSYDYIQCRAGSASYLEFPKHKNTSIPFQTIEDQVIEQCAKHSVLMTERLLSEDYSEEGEDPEILDIKNEIEATRQMISRFGDRGGHLESRVTFLHEQIAQIKNKEVHHVIQKELRDELMHLDNVEIWKLFSIDYRRQSFVKFIERVEIDFDNRVANVIFKRFLAL